MHFETKRSVGDLLPWDERLHHRYMLFHKDRLAR